MAHKKAAISRAIAATTAGGAEATIASAESDLRLLGYVANSLRQSLEPGSQGLADPGGIAVSQAASTKARRASIASERKARPADRIAGRELPRNQAKEGHQLRRRIEAAHIPISAAKVTATRNEAPRIA